jgi:predicted NBD/HSP70 family sugar kinase
VRLRQARLHRGYASAPSLVALATEAEMQMHGLQSETTVNSIDKMTVKQVLDNMVDNQVIHAVVLRQMDRLGLLLSNAVTVLDPDVLLIGGGVSEIESFPLAALETALRGNLAAGLQAGLVVQKALLGNQAALVGGMCGACTAGRRIIFSMECFCFIDVVF